MAALESSRDADKAHIAMLQEPLGRVPDEVSETVEGGVRRQVENQNQDGGSEHRQASLLESERQDRQSVEAINSRLAVRRSILK